MKNRVLLGFKPFLIPLSKKQAPYLDLFSSITFLISNKYLYLLIFLALKIISDLYVKTCPDTIPNCSYFFVQVEMLVQFL